MTEDLPDIFGQLIRIEVQCKHIREECRESSKEQVHAKWKSLVAIHRRLMYEHYNLYVRSQQTSDPTVSYWLLERHALPSRLWQHSILSVLELPPDLCPGFPDYMRAFWCIAHSMLGLLWETVPIFRAHWTYALGELTKYRLDTESMDLKDRMVCRDTARSWYRKALSLNPSNPMLYFKLGILAQPEPLPQISFFLLATICRERSNIAREKALLSLSSFLDCEGDYGLPLAENAFVTAIAVLFRGGHARQYSKALYTLRLVLDTHIANVSAEKFQITGASMALSLCAAILGFGADDSLLFHGSKSDHAEALKYSIDEAMDFQDHMVNSPVRVAAYACKLFYWTTAIILSRCQDRNVLSFAHNNLSFLSSIAWCPTAFVFVAHFVPWDVLARFLNVLVEKEEIDILNYASNESFECYSVDTRSLPEDVFLHGVLGKLGPPVISSNREEGGWIDVPDHHRVRVERCLWHALQIAKLSERLDFDLVTKRFSHSSTYQQPTSGQE